MPLLPVLRVLRFDRKYLKKSGVNPPNIMGTFVDGSLTLLQPLFGVDLARKDAKHALDLASASGVAMKNVETADGHLADVQVGLSRALPAL